MEGVELQLKRARGRSQLHSWMADDRTPALSSTFDLATSLSLARCSFTSWMTCIRPTLDCRQNPVSFSCWPRANETCASKRTFSSPRTKRPSPNASTLRFTASTAIGQVIRPSVACVVEAGGGGKTSRGIGEGVKVEI